MYRRNSLVPQTLLYQSYKLRQKVPFAIPSRDAELLPELCNRDVSSIKILRLAQGPWHGHNRDSRCKWQYVLPQKWEAPQPTLLAFLKVSNILAMFNWWPVQHILQLTFPHSRVQHVQTILEWEIFQVKLQRNIQEMFIVKNPAVYETLWKKYCRSRQAKDGNTVNVLCKLDT